MLPDAPPIDVTCYVNGQCSDRERTGADAEVAGV